MAVHLYGQTADMDAVLEICRRHDVPVIEDAAEALGALYKGRPAGSMGDVAAFSFNGNKIVTTTGGGMLVAKRQDGDKARFWSTQARDPGRAYHHTEMGYNYRMSNVLAGIGRGSSSARRARAPATGGGFPVPGRVRGPARDHAHAAGTLRSSHELALLLPRGS
jgi:hypothetical protein